MLFRNRYSSIMTFTRILSEATNSLPPCHLGDIYQSGRFLCYDKRYQNIQFWIEHQLGLVSRIISVSKTYLRSDKKGVWKSYIPKTPYALVVNPDTRIVSVYKHHLFQGAFCSAMSGDLAVYVSAKRFGKSPTNLIPVFARMFHV